MNNLLVSITKTTPVYTPETKAYEKLFDPKPGKNIFFDSMHIIKEAVNNANATCKPLEGDTSTTASVETKMSATASVETKLSEPIRFAMGGGKLYSLYQKALNTISSPTILAFLPTVPTIDTLTLVNILYNFQNIPFVQQYLQSRDKENIQLREKINQLFLLIIQQKQQSDLLTLLTSLGVNPDDSEGLGYANIMLSEMIDTLYNELHNDIIKVVNESFKVLSDNFEKLTDIKTIPSTFNNILILSTVLPNLTNFTLYDPSYEYAILDFLKKILPPPDVSTIDTDETEYYSNQINKIKYFLHNFQVIRYQYYLSTTKKLDEDVNPAADADFGMFYKDTALGATSCMTVCMILQLALKDLIEQNVIISSPGNEPWSGSEIDIGNSCIGTPPVTLSSLRIVINNALPFYNDIVPLPVPDETNPCKTYIRELLNMITPVKATISPFDFVQKGSLIGYIEHILEAVNTFGTLHISKSNMSKVASDLSEFCMITDECCSTPLKGIFDIFYTLFIIENFANRALVTQKINKELKRVAICAKVLFLHYNELYSRLTGEDDKNKIKYFLYILLEMCSFSFSQVPFSLNNESQMIYIMNKYVEFVNMIAKFALQAPSFLFFCTDKKPRNFTQIETIFNNLLLNSSMDNETKDKTYTLSHKSQLTSQLTECIPCVLDVLNKCEPGILQMLNNNKQYCAECDAMNKASGRIILSSAYQSVLWSSTKNYKTISKTRPSRDVSGLYDLYEKQATASTGNTFNKFITILMKALLTCNITTVPPTGAPPTGAPPTGAPPETLISILKLDDIDPQHRIITQESPYFQFLCWFLTCVFGVKAKSKKQKIASLTRKYLSLIDKQLTDLFGFTITITADTKNLLNSPTGSPTVSPTSSATGSATGYPLTCAGENTKNYLHLAYNNLFARMAYDKYDDYAKNHPKKPQDSAGANECHVILYDGEIAIKPHTPVMDFILTDLSGRFEKLPAGISKIIAVSEKMRGVLLNFLSSYQTPASVQKYLCSLSEDSFADILYVPGSHDARKFFELKPGERTLWLDYLIYKIKNSKNVVGDGTGQPDPNDRFFCIKLLFLLIKYLILPDISSGTPCETILLAAESVGLLNGLPEPHELNIPFLIKKINNYYDKCGQIERQQKVNALNADRKGITLSAVCAVPKKKSDASKVSEVSEKIVKNFNSAIVAAKKKAEKTTYPYHKKKKLNEVFF